MSAPDELVLVVPRTTVIDGAGWRGVRPDGLEQLRTALASEAHYGPRREMETNPAFKQVIPYLVVRDGAEYFLMRRTKAGGDARLHERWSIGVGGHLNPGDGDLDGGLRREWAEEIEADFVPDFRFFGLLNDDDSDVGRVHLGVVFLADAAGREVGVRETDKLEGRFASEADVEAVREGLETWSALVFDYLSSNPERFNTPY